MKHKHYDIICEWVAGKTIQYQSPTTDEWYDVVDINKLGDDDNYLMPNPIHPEYDWYDNWRVKPL